MNIELDVLAEAIAQRVRPAVPLSVALWDAETVAEYLKVSQRQVTERYALMPSFPRAIRLPADGGGHGRPRWKASEVIEWSERFQEKKKLA